MTNIGQALLFLDDEPWRQQRARQIWPVCTVVATAAECIRLLALRDWSTVSLDHDLGGEEYVKSDRVDCGFEVVRYIVQRQPRITEVICHSHFDAAAQNMVMVLRAAGYTAYKKRFGEGELWTPKK